MLLFSILAIVTGSTSYRGIVTFIEVHRRRLNTAFGLTWRRAPAHTAIRYILQGLDPAAVEAVFRQHAALLQAACAKPGQGSIALDGKTLRGSVDNFNDREFQRPCRRPGPERIRHRHIPRARPRRYRGEIQRNPSGPGAARRTRRPAGRDRHARCDALPKKHFEVAGQADIGLIVQVKNNQPTLLQTITDLAAAARPLSSCHDHDKGHGRDESLTVAVYDPAGKLVDADWQRHLQAIVRVERVVYTRSARTGLLSRTAEIAFYVSNKPLDAARAAQAIRDHWRVENTSHYTRDVTLGEDRSRIRSNPGAFTRLRSFGFNILKANRTGTLSQDRYRAALAGFDQWSDMLRI